MRKCSQTVRQDATSVEPNARELVKATRNPDPRRGSRLMRERGAHGFSMDVLAKEAGVARATVYEHFRSSTRCSTSSRRPTIAIVDARAQQQEQRRPTRRAARHARRGCRHWADCDEAVRELRTARGGKPAPARRPTASTLRISADSSRRLPRRVSCARGGQSTTPSTRSRSSPRTQPTNDCGGRTANAGAGRDAARQARRRHHLAGDTPATMPAV